MYYVGCNFHNICVLCNIDIFCHAIRTSQNYLIFWLLTVRKTIKAEPISVLIDTF